MKASYDRQALKTGIVHLGVGAFHRAHQAVYTDAVLRRFGGNWGICGISLRSPGVRDALAEHDCLYTVSVRGASGSSSTTVGALTRVLVAPEDPAAVVEAIAVPDVQVLTLTITEKGYCLAPASGLLDRNHPDIAHDLAQPDAPRSALGFLAAGLKARHKRGGSGLTVISCDNLAGNGRKLQAALIELARSLDADLAAWIEQSCRFPNSMVDRIVPAVTTADLATIAADLGEQDPAAVVTEPFSQWVIEKNFAGPLPAWDQVGAEYVDDVAPFEQMKLRLLNASHSCLAYLGSLCGYETVHEAINEPAIEGLIRQLMKAEMAPTLSGLNGFDLDAYQHSLITRFQNHHLPHQLSQIAMDGSQKIPQRLLPAIAERLAIGQDTEAGSCGLAAWILYSTGTHGPVAADPLQGDFARAYEASDGDMGRYLDALMQMAQIFPPALSRSAELKRSLLHWLQAFSAAGVLETVRARWSPGP